MIRTLIIAGTSLLIAGCATFAITGELDQTQGTHSSVSEPQQTYIDTETVVSRALCSRWLRDLTVAWSQRKYYCKGDDTDHKKPIDNTHRRLRDLSVVTVEQDAPSVKSTNHTSQKSPTSNPVVAIQIASTAAGPTTVERNSPPSDIEPTPVFIKAIVTPKPEPATPSKTALPVREAVQKQSPDPLPQGLSFDIPFASNVEVLGPKGKAATDRIARLIASKPNVVLRGFAHERDSETTNDQLAVARGLSVRKRLVDAGHAHHLKILYRQQHIDPDGRKVTVIIR